MTSKKDKKSQKFVNGTGRRKSAIASVWLYPKKGDIIVNGTQITDYFEDKNKTLKWVQPFHAIGVAHPQAKYSATIKVSGGGKNGQLDAVTLAISKALIKIDPEFKPVLKTQKLLTTDSRKVERKKPFLHKARKRPQYSKR